MKLGIVSILALGCWLLGVPALAGDRAPSTLPRSPVPPDAPRVFTATEDIVPPYEVTCEVKGDSIFAYISGVFVQKMVVPPRDAENIQTIAANYRKSFETRIKFNSILLITRSGGIGSIPLSKYHEFIRELSMARQGDRGPYRILMKSAVDAIIKDVRSR